MDGPVNENRDVLVVLEPPSGQADRAEAINGGLVAEGGRIANLLEGNLYALVSDSSIHGGHAWIQAAKALLEERRFRLILFAHTDTGSRSAPRLAHALGSAAILECFDVRFKNDNLHYAKYVHGGQYEREVTFTHSPEIASLNPESLEWPDIPAARTVPVQEIRIEIPESAEAAKTIRTIPPDFKTVEIGYSKQILDIGAGCDRPELLELAEELAGLLEASIGTTRLVVDGGRIAKSRMIGQTGKTVAPERCLAIGVSGSPHHVAGLLNSGTILSVNVDERAPIFGVSDAGFVSDLHALLPKLISRIKQYRDENLT